MGYNQRPAGAAGVETERLVSSGAVPPTVNPSPGDEKAAGGDEAPSGAGSAAGDNARSSPASAPETSQTSSAKSKRGGAAAPEVTETNLEEEESGHTAPAPAAAAPAAPKAASGIVVQVVASSTRQDAASVVDKLKSRGFAAFVVTPQEANLGDNLYRVEVGPFPTRGDAEKMRERLSGEGYKPFIRR